ncbi:thiamine pyrophosphokinase [Gnomoniopsis smithogilvyi]|uniref:Thiamine pyrophosphokinase n=1 Tax=Gnomoniopsis smithogilvyi TaxID=1191159 RepID=A0A9W8YTP4_9PEZI|nr:thiamine pyrophosphokinase [Gnomoniopsis smithogilvyi]
MGGPTEWYPARILQTGAADEDLTDPRFALIILNQPLRDVPTLKTLWKKASLKVAADGGANRLLQTCQNEQDGGHTFNDLDVIIGDLDSLTATTREYFTTRSQTTQIVHDSDQYSTDFGKAVNHIHSSTASRGKGPMDIVAMGGLGGRVDQGLSQLHHLYLFQTSPTYAHGRMFLVSGESLTFLLKTGRHRIHVREKDAAGKVLRDVFDKYVGIIPIKEPSVISTKGLEWDVEDWKTELGGMLSTSNHVLPETTVVEVETTKDVLFTIALKP